MVRVRNMPKNHDRRFGGKTCAPGGCDFARARAELHVAGDTAREPQSGLISRPARPLAREVIPNAPRAGALGDDLPDPLEEALVFYADLQAERAFVGHAKGTLGEVHGPGDGLVVASPPMDIHVQGCTRRLSGLLGDDVDVVALQAGVELEASKRRNRGGVIGLCMSSKGPPRPGSAGGRPSGAPRTWLL